MPPASRPAVGGAGDGDETGVRRWAASVAWSAIPRRGAVDSQKSWSLNLSPAGLSHAALAVPRVPVGMASGTKSRIGRPAAIANHWQKPTPAGNLKLKSRSKSMRPFQGFSTLGRRKTISRPDAPNVKISSSAGRFGRLSAFAHDAARRRGGTIKAGPALMVSDVSDQIGRRVPREPPAGSRDLAIGFHFFQEAA